MPPDDHHHAAPVGDGPAPWPPPGWPRTDRPLRIAILGWARISAQASEGSGYNLSKSELARGLVMSGHHVFYLSAGMTYTPRGGTRIVPREPWGGIDCYELLNSPNLAPSAHNFLNTATEIACPAETAIVLRWLDQVRAQVVHIHSLEGYGLDLVGAIEDSGRPVVVTLHNYAFICPQVDLLHKERQVCEDYDGGRRCVGCLDALPPAEAKRKRMVWQTLARKLGPVYADAIRSVVHSAGPAIGRLLGKKPPAAEKAPIHPNPDRLADPEVAWGCSITPPVAPAADPGRNGHAPAPAPVSQGLICHDLPLLPSEKPRDYHSAPLDQNERLLAAKKHLVVLNEYGRRRKAGVDALNRASLVIPPSDFLRKVHIAMGVEESRTRWVRLGQPHFDQINRRARRSPFYNVSPWDAKTATRPVRFAFFGTVRPNKGLEVLARAIPLLEREVRQRCQFSIYAGGNEWPFRKRLSLYPEVTVRGGYDLYQLIGSWGEYDVGILPHIWLENSPLVMLEHLHAGKFVICSRLGGPVDWITPPKNGLFFAGGNEAELADRIRQVATGEVRIPSPREVHEATVLQSYPDHVREIESIYHEVLAHRAAGRRSEAPPSTTPSPPPPSPAAV